MVERVKETSKMDQIDSKFQPYWKKYLIYSSAFVLRFILARTFMHEYFQGRPEVSTPINSMVRVKEGLALFKDGISPYEGDIFHATPLLLILIRFLNGIHPILVEILFPLCDLLTAFSLEIAGEAYLRHLKKKGNDLKEATSDNYKPLIVTEEDEKRIPKTTNLIYLFNPLSIVTCIAHATSTLNNTLIGAVLAFTLCKHPFLAMITLALATYNEFYPFFLLAPLILWYSLGPDGTFSKNRLPKNAIVALIVWSVSLGFLLFVSASICGDWSFLRGTYGFILSAQDLNPNPGLFWYFFTEMFEHFRTFFVWVFQMNPIVYVIPLAICLRDDPVVLWHQLVTIITIFKSYPSVGDASLVLSFLPVFSHLNRFIRHRFVIGVGFAACMALAPIMWYLWIHAGSANANFYFAITLVYSTAHIFLLTDLLYAHLRRQVHLEHGLKPKVNDKDAVVILK